MDKWDRKTNFNCDSCMFFVPKRDALIGGTIVDTDKGRCRRNAPTMKGYPVVYASDWCGEHKIGSNPVRDGKESEEKVEFCDICKIRPFRHISYGAEKSEETRCCQCHIAEGGTPADWHPECMRAYNAKKEKPLTKEDVQKVLDESLDSPCFDQPLVTHGGLAGKNVVISPEGTLKKVKIGQFPCEECCLKYSEEKAKRQQRAWGKDQIFHHCGVPGNIKPYPKVLCSQCGHTKTDDDFNAYEEVQRLFYTVSGASIMNAGLIEEKAKIKAEIQIALNYIDTRGIYLSGTPDNSIKPSVAKIKKLLEKI